MFPKIFERRNTMYILIFCDEQCETGSGILIDNKSKKEGDSVGNR